jgi:UDP-N-acetyl-D-mannosaminuronic acid transferase (WecB/TagA/CpsF family)
LGLEWLYRFLGEPTRLWKRYFIDDFPFFFLLVKQRLSLYQDPIVSLRQEEDDRSNM